MVVKWGKGIFAVGLALTVLIGLSASAWGSPGISPIRAWGWGVKDGQSKLEICTTSCLTGIGGAGTGELGATVGVAVDASGHVFVADTFYSRIEEFSSTGSFIRIWGWGVKDGQSQFEICTSSCQAGLLGAGAGELWDPTGVAVDASHHVFVADGGSNRINEFSSTGMFIKAWGWGVKDGQSKFEACTATCQAGSPTGAAGGLNLPQGAAVDHSGHLFVTEQNSQRVDEFSSSGAFLRGWGWGVRDGKSKFEICTATCQSGMGSQGAGAVWNPMGVGADASGHSFVADAVNSRIDEFSPLGSFIRAWGWGVRDGKSKLETCTAVCRTGTGGEQAGELEAPHGVAVDALGHVFVTDYPGQRIDEYSSVGAFITAWGWGVKDGQNKFETCTVLCRGGLGGGGAGEFNNPQGVAVDGSGHLFDGTAYNYRIDEFSLPSPPACVVPALTGKTLAAAQTALTNAHCALGAVAHKKSSGKAGIVLSQSPTPGKRLPAGSKVNVVVSKH